MSRITSGCVTFHASGGSASVDRPRAMSAVPIAPSSSRRGGSQSRPATGGWMLLFTSMTRIIQILTIATALVAAPAAVRADDAGALYKQGMALAEQNQDDAAIAKLEAAVAADNNHAMAWATLGKLYKKKQNYPKAVTAYEEATRLRPKDAVLWGNLGFAYYRAGREDDAVKALHTSCTLDSKDASVQAFLGTILRKKGDLKGAITHLCRAHRLNKQDHETANNLGVAFRLNKEHGKALTMFKRALA